MSIFAKIAQKYGWELQGDPVCLTGGLMHKMYRFDTAQGVYAVKLLNPFVMQRETALENFSKAEQLERILEQQGLPILPARSFGDRKMQTLDGAYFYIFDYFPGSALQSHEVTAYHCKEIGKTLAKIHNAHKCFGRKSVPKTRIDWDFYLAKLKTADAGLYAILRDGLPAILDSQHRADPAKSSLPPILSICHNDMDWKNVLWSGKAHRVIDLECLSYSHPHAELLETALCWSGCEECRFDEALFHAFLQGYRDAGGEMPADWEALYDGNSSRLRWLEYNLKRVLGIDCGPEETALGRTQAEETVARIVYYADQKARILSLCAPYTKV